MSEYKDIEIINKIGDRLRNCKICSLEDFVNSCKSLREASRELRKEPSTVWTMMKKKEDYIVIFITKDPIVVLTRDVKKR